MLEFTVIAFVAIVGVVVAVAALRLLAGPVNLEFLKPRIAQEFDTPAGKMRINADGIYAEWSSLSQPMRLVAVGLHVMEAGGREVARAPSVALTFEALGRCVGQRLPA